MSAGEEIRREELLSLWEEVFRMVETDRQLRRDLDSLHAVVPMLNAALERVAENKRQMLHLIGLQHEELTHHQRVLARRTRRTVARRRPPR